MMSDETENDDTATDDDSGAGGAAAASSDLNLDEIEESAEFQNQDEREFEIGEPMAGDVAAIYDIPVNVSAVLGRSTMQVSQLLKLGRVAVVELDRKVERTL